MHKPYRTRDEMLHRYNVTLNPELVDELREFGKIHNLSAWLNERIRLYVLDLKDYAILMCNAPHPTGAGRCNAAMVPRGWKEEHDLICPKCGHDHKGQDLRLVLDQSKMNVVQQRLITAKEAEKEADDVLRTL